MAAIPDALIVAHPDNRRTIRRPSFRRPNDRFDSCRM